MKKLHLNNGGYMKPFCKSRDILALVVLFLIFTVAGCGVKPSSCPESDLMRNSKDSELGIIVLAHGSTEEWNDRVRSAVDAVKGSHKTMVVFGMGDAETIQKASYKLYADGAKAIIIIPFFISSHSEMYRQIEYVLGIRKEPDVLFSLMMERMAHSSHTRRYASTEQKPFNPEARAEFPIPYAVMGPIDFSYQFTIILSDRLSAVSKKNDGKKNKRIFDRSRTCYRER